MIPRVVHRIWLGGPEPEWTQPFADTWRLPGWNLRQWNEDSVASLFPLFNQSLFDNPPDLTPNHLGQFRADLLRYEILHRFGGVWVDTDLECLRPIEPLIDGHECFAAWEEQGRWIANGFMGAAPGHPFIGRLIDGIPASVRRNEGQRPNRLTGPQYLTRQWRAHGRREMAVIEQRLVYPYGHREIADNGPGRDWGDAYCVHHWANARTRFGVPVG